MEDLHLFIRSVKFNDQEIHLSAFRDHGDLAHDKDALSVIFFRQKSQRSLIESFRILFAEFLHFVLKFFFQRLFSIAFFQKGGLTQRILERFRIRRIPLLHDVGSSKFRERLRRERQFFHRSGFRSFRFRSFRFHSSIRTVRIFCRFIIRHQSLKFEFAIHLRNIQTAVRIRLRILICLRRGRIFSRKLLDKITGRIKSVERVLPDFHRNLRIVFHVFVALLNERRRDRIKSAFLRFSRAEEDPPDDIVRKGDRTQTAKHHFDQLAKNALLFLRRLHTANDPFRRRRRCSRLAIFQTVDGRRLISIRFWSSFVKSAQHIDRSFRRFRSFRSLGSHTKIQKIDR